MIVLATASVLVLTACADLGVGEADCSSPERGLSSANVMTVQAVPTARYTPCLEELRPGWDSVTWFAENGRAGIEIEKGTVPFLSATVTGSCDVSGAAQVFSGFTDIQRFEDVEFGPVEINVTIVPSESKGLVMSQRLVDRLGGEEIDDRPVVYKIDHDMDRTMTARISDALMAKEYVWIIDELDAEEGTVDLRSNDTRVAANRINPEDALEVIEDFAPGAFYRGNWFFTFDGGCITYEFDAEGTLAATIAADADESIGFYPAYQLIEIATDAGYDLVE